MEDNEHIELVEQILRPKRNHAEKILNDLGLDGLPSQERVHQEIEEKLLLPKEKLPSHWLPTYQV